MKLYTVIYDSTASSIAGDVRFDMDSVPLQTVHFSLNAGETQIVSADWTAIAGEHAFGASLENVSGLSETLPQTSTNVVRMAVAATPASPVAQYTTTIQQYIASSSPAAANAIQTIASTTENWRAKGSEYLSAALVDQAAKTTTVGTSDPQVLGTSTQRTVATSASSTTLFSRARTMLLKALLFVCQVQWLFYLMLLVVLYIVYKVLRALFAGRRRAYYE